MSLQAQVAVIPCNVYHIKLAIADGSDDSYDSGVFLKAGSFDVPNQEALNVNTVTTDILCYGDTTGTVNYVFQGESNPTQQTGSVLIQIV